MANKTFETRIQLKYDSYANWTANNPTPLSGEVCIVVIPAETGAVVQKPSILFKVGDGSTAFNSLPYVSAVAADVYDWAKAAAKPSYTADEISGLADYIAGEIQDTNTQYKLEQDTTDAHILKLYKKDLADADWSVVATITTADTVYDDTALAGRVTNVEDRATALEGLVGSVAVATQIANAIAALDLANTYDAKGAAAQALTDAKTYADGLVAGLNGTGAGSVDKKITDAFNDFATKVTDDGVVNSYKELIDWAATHGAEAAEMAGAITALQNILAGIGGEGESATVVAYVQAAIDALKIGDYAKAADLTALAERVTTVETEVAKKANDADLAAVAKSGKVEDLAQDGYIIFNCGSSSTVI